MRKFWHWTFLILGLLALSACSERLAYRLPVEYGALGHGLRLELPPGWSMLPCAAELEINEYAGTRQAWFVRELDDHRTLTVNVTLFTSGAGRNAIPDKFQAEIQQQPGFQHVSEFYGESYTVVTYGFDPKIAACCGAGALIVRELRHDPVIYLLVEGGWHSVDDQAGYQDFEMIWKNIELD